MKKMQPGDMLKAFQKKKKNWIAGAIKHPGALHRELGVKQGTKIPAKKLATAAKKGGKEGKRARLAETLKGFHKGKKKHKMLSAGDAMKSAYESKYGKVPSTPAVKPMGKLSSGSLGNMSQTTKMFKKRKKSGLRSAAAVVKSEQNASHQTYKKCKKHKMMKCKKCK